MLTIATLRICGKQIGSKMEGIGHNETCVIVAVLLFSIAIFSSLWVDAGMMYYYFRKYEQADKKGRNIIVQNEVKGEEQGCLE